MRELSCLNDLVLCGNAALRQIVRRHFHRYFVAGRKADPLRAGLPRRICQKPMPVREFHPKQDVLQNFHYGTFNFDGIFSRHVNISGSDAVINTVCSKWADSEPSCVTAVQPSFKIFTAGPPAFTIGSMARVMPGNSRWSLALEST